MKDEVNENQHQFLTPEIKKTQPESQTLSQANPPENQTETPLVKKRTRKRRALTLNWREELRAQRAKLKAERVKKKMGRPAKFKDYMLEQAEKLGALGLTYSQICNVLDISHETFARWRRKNPEFDEALRRGRDKADAQVISSLYKNATEKMNLGAQCFWLKNRLPDKFKEDFLNNNFIDNSKHVHLTFADLAKLVRERENENSGRRDGNSGDDEEKPGAFLEGNSWRDSVV